MKILLCNNTLSILAGSETATHAMAVELKRLGHTVTAYSRNIGEIAEKFKEAGVEVVDTLDGRRDDFDVIIANHYDPTNYVKSKCPNTPIIFTVHGIIGGPETPPLYCDAFVAVSEEVQAAMKEKHGVDCEIIRNGVDLERFKETKPRENEIKNLLISTSYYHSKSAAFIAIVNACRVLNITVHATGKDFSWMWDMPEIYNKVDAVVTLGRGCLEAMACGRPAIVIGHWGRNQELSGDGLVTPDTIKEIRKNNFSSRRYRHEWGVPEIVDELKKAQAIEFDPVDLVKDEHNIKNVVKRYLEIAARITGKDFMHEQGKNPATNEGDPQAGKTASSGSSGAGTDKK